MALLAKPIVNIGGLMRCCIESIRAYEMYETIDCDGTVVHCVACKDSAIIRNGKWEWNREKESADGKATDNDNGRRNQGGDAVGQ